jgi:LL-H family phage holin
MRDIVLELLKLTIMIATMLVTRYLIPWLKAKTQNETMHALIDWAVQAVLAAEQCHQAVSGPERKAIVTKFIKQILEQKNIALSDEEIDVMIEAAVKQMNAGLNNG